MLRTKTPIEGGPDHFLESTYNGGKGARQQTTHIEQTDKGARMMPTIELHKQEHSGVASSAMWSLRRTAQQPLLESLLWMSVKLRPNTTVTCQTSLSSEGTKTIKAIGTTSQLHAICLERRLRKHELSLLLSCSCNLSHGYQLLLQSEMVSH